MKERIREMDDMGCRCGEDSVERGDENVIRRVVGPESEDALRIKLRGETAKSVDFVECTVPAVQEILR